MRRFRNTKIVATLGPASDSPQMIERLFVAGADVFRLNFSHGDQQTKAKIVAAIRQISAKMHRPVGILADLQGPKLRVGTFKQGKIALKLGQKFTFCLDAVEGDEQQVTLPHPEIFEVMEPGAWLYLNDGNVRMRVFDCSAKRIVAEVMAGNALSDRKGVNLPDRVLNISPLTPKDREDLACALELGVDWVAMSFVQKPQDLLEGQRLIGGRAKLMAKLEKPSAVQEHLQAMVREADGIMVARGDLGVEMPPETVPAWQKEIIQACRRAGKPVVVATQMLESMINAPTPTRAEASDVATAVFDGADAVMLSAESAAGNFPVEAVSMMDRIIKQTEQGRFYRPAIEALSQSSDQTDSDAISHAANAVARAIDARAVVTHTRSGATAYRAARERPQAPILCITQSPEAARQLALVWGVHAVHTEPIENVAAAVDVAQRMAIREGLAQPGDKVVMTAGAPFGRAGSTNTLRIVDITAG